MPKLIQKSEAAVGELTQYEKVLYIKPQNLQYIFNTHMIRDETSSKILSSDFPATCALWYTSLKINAENKFSVHYILCLQFHFFYYLKIFRDKWQTLLFTLLSFLLSPHFTNILIAVKDTRTPAVYSSWPTCSLSLQHSLQGGIKTQAFCLGFVSMCFVTPTRSQHDIAQGCIDCALIFFYLKYFFYMGPGGGGVCL